MYLKPLDRMLIAAALACLLSAATPAFSQARPARPVPQPQKIWGLNNVTLHRNSPKYFSDSGNHYLVYQADGNLVIYTKGGQFAWGFNSATNQFAAAQRITFVNGNMIAFDQGGKVIWQAIASPAAVDPAGRPYLNENGVLQITSCRIWGPGGATKGGVSWATDNKTTKVCGEQTQTQSPPAPTEPVVQTSVSKMPIPAGSFVQADRDSISYASGSGRHRLRFWGDGTMVVESKGAGANWDNAWKLNPALGGVKRVGLRSDGSFVALGDNDRVIWKAPLTRLDPKSQVNITPYGALQVVASNREVLWSSDGILSSTQITKLPIPARGFVSVPGEYVSESGNHRLKVFWDGTMGIESTKGGAASYWRLPNSKGATRVGLQSDGSFVALGDNNRVVWKAPSTRQDPNSKVVVSTEGALHVVASNGDILWSSDGITAAPVKVFLNPPAALKCNPEKGWTQCLVMTSPKITIHGSRLVTPAAMKAVANVYAAMFAAMRPKFPASVFDGHKVYLTNGEPYSELKSTAVDSWPDVPGQKGGNFLRGFGGADKVWISEQMICKIGVKTRNQNLAAAGLSQPDNAERTFDQVVHEMAHAIDARYPGFEKMNDSALARHPSGRTEGFAQSVQHWFGASQGDMHVPFQGYLGSTLFQSRARFSCEGYRP